MTGTPARLRRACLALAVLALGSVLSLDGPGAVLAAADGADFAVRPERPIAGQGVTFTATGLKPGDVVTWDFEGDGSFDATGTTVEHVFATAGQRTVHMRAARPAGDQPRDVMKTVTVVSANRAPVASFTFYPRQPRSGDRVELVSTSFDAEGRIAGQAWDLDGDGQFDDSSGITAARTFSAPGSYTVRLRVTDTAGAADVESRPITVGGGLASSSGRGLMSPFPVVRIIGRSTGWGARIKLIMVKSAPRGAKLTVRCRGDGCPRRRTTRILRSGRLRVRSFERLMAPGVSIRIFVTKRGSIGKYTSFKIRRTRPPLRRDLCVTSAQAKPKRCPSS